MEYASSPLELWNLCQHSLLRHGELHNNLRMTWGKAIPLWTESLEHSLFIGQMLNDKYALDGRDPSSVVGIQWCHGLFDRPFFPSMQVMGVVRKRDVVTHSSRLDVDRYGTHIHRNQSLIQATHYVVENGIFSSCIARMLHDHGLTVHILSSKSESFDDGHALDALADGLFPHWMEQRVASMCESQQISTVADIEAQLRMGIPFVDALPQDETVSFLHDSQNPSTPQGSLAMKIDHAIWQSVEILWGMNTSVETKKTSRQTRLI